MQTVVKGILPSSISIFPATSHLAGSVSFGASRNVLNTLAQSDSGISKSLNVVSKLETDALIETIASVAGMFGVCGDPLHPVTAMSTRSHKRFLTERVSKLVSGITSGFTGPRRTALISKPARPAAPCATRCYPAFERPRVTPLRFPARSTGCPTFGNTLEWLLDP